MIIPDEASEWDLETQFARLCQPVDFHGAAILDGDGNEIFITEDMIQGACDGLCESWLFPRSGTEPVITRQTIEAFDGKDTDATIPFYRPPDLSDEPKT